MNVHLTNDGEKFAFLSGLKQFLEDKGKVLLLHPRLAGINIDLHDLYNKVTALGGYQKVTEKELWESLLREYNFETISSTLCYGLKVIYQRFLEEYERVHYFGDDEASKKPRFDFSIKVNRKSSTYFTDSDRRMYNLHSSSNSLNFHNFNNYERLAFSLISCLPNEVDFAINACTLLSGESRHVLRLSQCPQVLEALLLHAGIVSDSFTSLAEIAETWINQTKHDLLKFWTNTVEDRVVIKEMLFANSNVYNCQNKTLQVDGVEMEICNWSSLFQSSRAPGVQDYEGQRVLQIALVLLNLSFEEFNVFLLACSKPLVRFTFLCIHSSYSALRQTGLDIFGNISSKMDLLALGVNVLHCTFKTIKQCILSFDKFDKVRGYEILGNLCRSPSNRDYIISAIHDEIYSSALELLTLGDIELMLAALDALYNLSKLGEETCTKIMLIPGSIDTLICLITINVRTLGSEYLSKIRIVKRILPTATTTISSDQRSIQVGVNSGLGSHRQLPQHSSSKLPSQFLPPQHLSTSYHPPTPQLHTAFQKQPPTVPCHMPPQIIRASYPQVVPPTNNPLQIALSSQPTCNPQVIRPPQIAPSAHITSSFANQSIHTRPPQVNQPFQLPHHPHIGIPPQFHQPLQTSHPQATHMPQIAIVPHVRPTTQVSQSVKKVVPPSQGGQHSSTSHPTGASPTTQASSLSHVASTSVKTVSSVSPPTVCNSSISQNKSHKAPNQVKEKKKNGEVQTCREVCGKHTSVPIYTHTESQCDPPVFHYIPAPPPNIVLDKSPESFAQLWVWATYESCANEVASTPRVEMFADYAAAATRYGMHGTKQVLPAAEFGRCLQQVFPLAASRLFTDKDGQPMYHITGITKRPTPLPVPGHHPQSSLTEQINVKEIPTSTSPVSTSTTPSVLSGTQPPSLSGATSNDARASKDTVSAVTTTESSTTTQTLQTSSNPPSSCRLSTNSTSTVTSSSHNSNISPSMEGNESPHNDEHLATGTNNKEDDVITDENYMKKEVKSNHCNNHDSHDSCQAREINTTNDSYTPPLKSPEKMNSHCEINKPEPLTNGDIEMDSTNMESDMKSKLSQSILVPEETNQNKEAASTTKCNGDVSNSLNSPSSKCVSSSHEVDAAKMKETSLVNGGLEKDNTTAHSSVPSHSITIPPQTPPIVPQKLVQPPPTIRSTQGSTAPPGVKTNPLKRPLPEVINSSVVAPPMKVHKSLPQQLPPCPPKNFRPPLPVAPPVRHLPPPFFNQSSTPQPLPSIPTSSKINHPISTNPQSIPPQHRLPPPPPVQHAPQSKPPVIDLMAPNASLMVLMRNCGRYHFDDASDEKEDPISKSIRLTAVLILINICRHSDEGRSMLQRHESQLAYLSMSRMDCSSMLAKLLAEMDR